MAASNPAEGMDVPLLCVCVFCVLRRYRPLRRADHSVRGVLPDVCIIV